MCEILCSTGAIIGLPNGRDYNLLKPFSEKLECDGFEFMMYSTWYEEMNSILKAIRAMQVKIPVMHCEKHIGESISKGDLATALDLFEKNVYIAGELGAKKLVIHLWDGMTSDSNFGSNLEAYAKLRALTDESGIDLLVENIVCTHQDPMSRWKQLADVYQDIHFVFDTKMAEFHGQTELLYAPENDWLWKDGHVCHYHVNDYGGAFKEWAKLKTLPIGKGHVDFHAFFDFIHKIGYNDTFTVESTAFDAQGVVDFEMLNAQFRHIKEAMQGEKT